jgi:hypothetical protein
MDFRLLRQFLICSTLLGLGLSFLYLQQIAPVENIASLPGQTASYTYFGPDKPVPGNPQLVRLEVLIRDSPDADGLQIVSAEFNHTNIPLKPRDIYGNRGNASFQVKPGTYKLQWVVNRDKFAWPRTITHEEVVTVSPRDLWLQISIEGETASIR